MNNVVLTVEEPLQTRCAACFEDKECFRCDCQCHDLDMCEGCWYEWVTDETYTLKKVETPNNIHEKTQVLICAKCNTTAFTCENEERVDYGLMLTWIIFGAIGLALVIFANVSVFEDKNHERNMIVFVAFIDVCSLVIVCLLTVNMKKLQQQTEQTCAIDLKCSNGGVREVYINND